MKNKILEMLVLQEKMNTKVNPNWKTANYCWTDAIMVEAVEAIEHYGWKWWKKQDPNIGQVKMELVDIWHFALSHAIVESGLTIEELSLQITNSFNKEDWISEGHISFIDYMKDVIRGSTNNSFSGASFFFAMDKIGMSFEELYCMYTGKNALNNFRQDNGYKTGTYNKDWNGKEDNEYLMFLINNSIEYFDIKNNFYDFIYNELKNKYNELNK